MGTLSRFLRRTPFSLRRVAYKMVPFGLRYGKQFTRRLRFLEDSGSASADHLAEYQWLSLSQLLHHAYDNVPYYRKAFDKLDARPWEIKSLEDWQRLDFPVLTREALVANRHELIAQNLRFEREHRFTFLKSSGSTGTPVQVLAYKEIYEDEAAFIERVFRANGATLYFDKTVWLRRYCPDTERGDPLFYWDAEQQRYYMSAFHLNRDSAREYADAINRTKAKTLVTYPSAAYVLARLCREQGIGLDHIRHIQVSSEQLLPEWGNLVESAFPGITIRDHYGQIEKACLHHRCSGGRYYHDNVEYGLTEITPENLIVATGFLNWLMPLIRYDTGDYAQPATWKGEGPCIGCGMTLPTTIKAIEGRHDDILETPSGNFLPGVNFYTMFYKIRGVAMFQVVQEGPRDLTVRVVPGDGYGADTEREILAEMRRRVGNMHVLVAPCGEIERDEKTGKIRCVLKRRPRE